MRPESKPIRGITLARLCYGHNRQNRKNGREIWAILEKAPNARGYAHEEAVLSLVERAFNQIVPPKRPKLKSKLKKKNEDEKA